jgi:hypothetical protein
MRLESKQELGDCIMFHIRIGEYARAYHKPNGIIGRLVMLNRGWRPFNHIWWAKPSKNQASLEKSFT